MNKKGELVTLYSYNINGEMSDFVVSARRYRPQKFDELIGQEHVSSTLQKALTSGQLAHAFLFCGPRGVGKTSCARILAKVINCENPINPYTACDKCSSCKSFNEGTSFNIIEQDAASNNGIENIRALNEQVRFQPQQGKYKIFIIDEVHMLSTGAFNAFLKTLEEPPPYAIFILATTEKHKIIPTILSRCQIFDFKRIQVQGIIKQLEYIVRSEGKSADHEALRIIAQKADGAMRDALSIYDRISSSAGDQISYQKVVKNLNVLDYDYFFKITDAFLAEDLAAVLLTFDEILENGFDGDHFINGLSSHFRDLLVCLDDETIALLEVGNELKSRYKEQALKTSKSFLLSTLHLTNACDIHYKMVKNQRLHVEICLAKIAYIQRKIEVNESTFLSTEKKTSDLSDTKSSVVELKEGGQSHKEEKHEKTSNIPKEIKVEIKGPKPKKSRTAIPSIGNLDDLVNNVAAEESSKAENNKSLNLDDINKIIELYKKEHSSPSMLSILNICIISIIDNRISILVPTQVSKETIYQETALMDKIRKFYHKPNLRIDIEVDREKFPDFEEILNVKPLTPKEKMEKFSLQNPLVNELAKRFKLRPDNE